MSKSDASSIGAASESLAAWLASLRVAAPAIHGALSVYAIHPSEPPAGLAYQTLGEALAHGQASVVEALQASVPTLRVENRGEQPLLILDGEEVVGGRQNRVVNTSLLVPAGSSFDLPVSCVEQGRWHPSAAGFAVGEAAYPELRRQKVEQVSASLGRQGRPVADQGAIWREVAGLHQRRGARSRTGAMMDAYAASQEQLRATERALAAPPTGAVGVLAAIGGRARCADIFDRPETLRSYWPRLIRSYALEALGTPARPPDPGSARRLLLRAQLARHTAFPSPGLGLDLRLAGHGIVGASLVEAGVAVHTAIFRQPGRSAHRPVQAPGRRAARLSQPTAWREV